MSIEVSRPDGRGASRAALRWGVLLPTFDPFRRGTPPLVPGARLAERLGFDSGWVGDHLSFHPPLLESICSLAAAAAVTSRLDLGVGVLLLPLRNPVWAAKQLTTVDALAPGRLTVGTGVGGENPQEYEAAGVPLTERGRRLDEALDVLPDLLVGKPVDYAGRYLNVRSPGLEPACTRPPTLLIGGRSEVAIERAATRGDGWLGLWTSPQQMAERAARIRARAAELDRPRPRISLMVMTNVHDDAVRAREDAAAMLHGQYRLPFHVVERYTAYGPAQRVAEFLSAYAAAGVDEFILIPAASDPLRQFDHFATVRATVDAATTTPGMHRRS